MKVLLSVTSFSPDYGGPALSVSRLGAALAKAGASVGLYAPDGSASTSPVVEAAACHAGGRSLVRLPATLADAFAFRPDIIHDNGLWLAHNRAIARAANRAGIARVIAPRGMLEPWAFGYKPWKKRLAWHLYQRRDVASAAALHATAAEEADNLGRFGLSVPVTVAPNGVDVPDTLMRPPHEGDRRTILFLSRVHPKKGLPLLIEAFARLRPDHWEVVIAGPDELGHTSELRSLAEAKGVTDRIRFVGPQYGEAKTALLSSADLFVLPTHSENFGIAIAEALAHAVPVVTTTGAPWPMLREEGYGYQVAPEADAITDALREALALGDAERTAMGLRGRAMVTQRFGWDGIATTLLVLYRSLSPPRACP